MFKSHLVKPPSVVAPRLAEVKGQVLEALADDFDTPRAVHALMDLVSHGNRQLQPIAEVTVLF